MPHATTPRCEERPSRAVESQDAIVHRLAEVRQRGLLAPGNASARTLREVAAIDLSLGRLYEGHVNALRLIDAHGSADQRRRYRAEAEDGRLFGVWGADGDTPVQVAGRRLTGAKRFASGLGLVERALVTAEAAEGQRLFVVRAGDRARHDASGWDMAGMQDSRSGRFDCEGIEGDLLGPPDVYMTEPYFVGGTWRIAAVTLGATAALVDRAAQALREDGRMEAEAQLLRLAPLATRAVAAWPAIRRAAEVAEGAGGAADPQRAATLSVSVRLLTEALAQDVIAGVERSIGLAMFANAHPVGRAARDLACYVRQAAPDAFTLRVGRAMLLDRPGLGGWMDD